MYTEELIKYLKEPGLELQHIFKRTGMKVQEKSQKQQEPWISSNLYIDFYFSGKKQTAKEENTVVVTPKPAPTTSKTFTNTIGMEFVQIHAGEFLMGCSEGDSDCEDREKPAHKVKIKKSFYMGKYEVTQRQWKKIMGDNPSHFQDCGEDCPVEKVSWEDTQKYIQKLNSKEGTSTALRCVRKRLVSLVN